MSRQWLNALRDDRKRTESPLTAEGDLCYNIGVESRKEKDMNDINDIIATYEANLKNAERSIEKALQSMCDLYGDSEITAVRKTLNEALTMVQHNLCGTFKLYDNPDIKRA